MSESARRGSFFNTIAPPPAPAPHIRRRGRGDNAPARQRRSGIDVKEARVGVGAPDEGGMKQTVKPDVVEVAAAPRHQAGGLDAPDARARVPRNMGLGP